MRALFNILAVSLMVIFVSCEKHEQIGGYGTDGTISISLKCTNLENVGGDTKSLGQLPNEGLAANYKVKDYWILQYTSSGDFIEKSAKYIEVVDGEEVKTPVIMPHENNMYYCLFIANTHNPQLNTEFDEFKGTLSSMTQFYKNIASLEDTYNSVEVEGETEPQDLVMSGIAQLPYGATELTCKLYRNIAKVTITLKNQAGSDLTIKSVNIKNVPGGALYADALLKVSSIPGINAVAAPYPDNYSLPYLDYELDNISVTAGTQKDFVWYLPRNMKGTVKEITSADQKNKLAPELSTYIEIFATTSAGELFKYKFYLGANATTDFNVEPNKHYKLPITFVDKGTVLDSRVTDYTVLELSGKSNSYIINPLPIENRKVSLPVSRINEFWSSTDGLASNADNTISASTEWVAEVIWQDQPARLINFSGDNTDSFSATGDTPIGFEVLKGAKGNVVIGVRKTNETEYLWSWHLWITEYNPDECTTPWITDKYVYFVTGGQVHRYAGDFWETSYKNRYIMDRHLGALSATRADGIDATSGFLYQYGRKDPFPYTNKPIYNINGEAISFSGNNENPMGIITGPVNLYKSVNNPASFVSVSSGDWASDNALYKGVSYSWNGESGKKSIFDPCPEGWMVPKNEIWSNFGDGTEINMTGNSVKYNTIEAGIEFYLDGPKDGAHKEYNIAYYPAAGYRSPAGAGARYKTRSYVHSTQGKIHAKNNACLDFVLNPITISTTEASSMSRGASVRCVREKGIASGNEEENNKNNEEYNEIPW